MLQVLLRSVLFGEELCLETIESILESPVLLDELDVLLSQVLFILAQHFYFSALCLLLAESRPPWGMLRGLFIVEAHFFLEELLLLLGEVVVSEELVVPCSFFT